MKQIKASEVKPGMTIRWEVKGLTHECTVSKTTFLSTDALYLRSSEGGDGYIPSDSLVTVLAEPPVEEPTAFGARVVADGHEFLLSHGGRRSWKARLDGKRYAWTDLCDMGSVVVIDATPSWTVPEQVTETPVVPERIEEWPEDDTHLREQRWRDRKGAVWSSRDGQWGYHSFTMGWMGLVGNRYPFDGPWDRVP
ncbi:hypothetical protein [Kocuria tytonis]|uniref:Uncharacterized protein n=1 Tax=Kocuria tytonis TaxID=2054280 RepID=A0A495A895_9MICC|nr:hypothetical protein [Kocuria tytonis]RKQ36229.1 hypothetical protein C1C97_000640 [Kocuria tytonis]